MAKKKAAKKPPARKKPTNGMPGSRVGWTWGPAKPKPTHTIYQFRIVLLGIHPPIWRRIRVEDCFLDDFHHHIQAAMGWTNSHLHVFDIDDLVYGRPGTYGPGDEGRIIDESKILLSVVVPHSKPNTKTGARPRLTFRYTYDMGDNWEHEILFEGIAKPDSSTKYPVCVEGQRAGPPENCGGTPGYEHLLEVLADPSLEEYQDALHWVGEDFDPELFDARIATVRMVRGLRG